MPAVVARSSSPSKERPGAQVNLDEARALNAKERCRLLPMAPKDASSSRALRHMERRSVDFTQVYPEWGHATNASAVIGRRGLTKGLCLDRRAFLHSYDPYDDPSYQ